MVELSLTGIRIEDVEDPSSELTWREFEELVERIFVSFGFTTKRNYRLKKPTAEIDILAIKSGLAFVIDCKHWKRTVGSAVMLRVSEKQVERAKRMLTLEEVQKVIPSVITLRDEFLQILDNGTPVVPIHKISDFILNWESEPRITVFDKHSQ